MRKIIFIILIFFAFTSDSSSEMNDICKWRMVSDKK